MKKQLLFFAFLLFLITQTKWQTSVYHAFPDSDAVWIYSYYAGCSGGPNGSCGYFYDKMNGDTVIGSYTYKQIWGTGLNLSTYRYVAAIREDTVARKVYCIGVCGNTDTLLFDFNVQPGDTLIQCEGNDTPDSGLVKSVDSVLVSGSWRKRINVWGGNYIEGIGGFSGVFSMWSETLEGFFGLVCFSVDGVSLYPDSTCMLTGINVLNDNSNPDIKLLPNPASNQLTIQLSPDHADEGVTVSVMDVMGRKTSPPASLQGEKGVATIDVRGLAAGMYFVEVTSDGGRWVGRFVKE